MKTVFNLRGDRKFVVGKKILVMGIVNVTPDSFSDGGEFFSPKAAINHAAQLIDDGADIIDIGGESTRPNALPVTADEEISRLEKILPAVKNFGVPISIDTYKPEVAVRALELGADIVNDVHGLEDLRMIDAAKKFDAPVIAGHFDPCNAGDIVGEVQKFFRRTAANCSARGFDTTKIIFDPGIGFGKNHDENLTLLRNLNALKILDGREIFLMLGVSRKSIIGKLTGLEVCDRDEATGALCVQAALNGVDIVRVHNVKMISRMIRAINSLLDR